MKKDWSKGYDRGLMSAIAAGNLAEKMKVVSIWARAFGEGIRVTLESRQQSP